MKINYIIFYILLILLVSKIGNSFEITISNKYDDIFSNSLLNNNDVENYRKI